MTITERHNPFAPSPSIFGTIPCPSPGCNRWFRNNGGLTKHRRARHQIAPQQQPEPPNLAPWLSDDIPPGDFDAPAGGDTPVDDGEGFEWEHHPLLCGTLSLSIFSTEGLTAVPVYPSDAVQRSGTISSTGYSTIATSNSISK